RDAESSGVGLRLPGSPVAALLTLDPRTHRPDRLEVPGVLGRLSFAIDGWRECAGWLVPHRLVTRYGQDVTGVFAVQSGSPREGLQQRDLAPPRVPDDASFRSDVPSRVLTHQTRSRHLLVRMQVAGRD